MKSTDAMINPSIVSLLEKVDNRYSLVIVTSKRARMIIGPDAEEEENEEDTEMYELRCPLVKVNSNKPLTIAINEVEKGYIKVTEKLEGVTEKVEMIVDEQ